MKNCFIHNFGFVIYKLKYRNKTSVLLFKVSLCVIKPIIFIFKYKQNKVARTKYWFYVVV